MTTKQLLSRNVLMGILHIALILFFATQLHSCTDEQTDHLTPDEENTITFSVKTPGVFTPTSYALTESQENAIETIDVLIFKNGNYSSGPHYASIGTPAAPDGDSKVYTPVTIRIPDGVDITSADYSVEVFANSRAIINTAAGTTGFENTETRDVVFGKLSVNLSTGNGKWIDATNNPKYAAIPMHATLNRSTSKADLARMLARINVDISAIAIADFKLTSVSLYNHNTKGYVAATAASTLNAFASSASGELKYTTGSNTFENEIYTFEAATGSDPAVFTVGNPCLVIGGEYKAEEGKNYFYRVDFFGKENGTGNDKYLPLLRNHSYEVIVSKIFGPGYTDPDDAAASKPVNINYTIQEWNDNNIIDAGYNGQYMIGTSASKFTFDALPKNKYTGNNILYIQTDHPSGWTAEITESWLTLITTDASAATVTSGPTGASAVKLQLTKNEGSERTAIIKLKAGNVIYPVTVTQSNTVPNYTNFQPESNCYIVSTSSNIFIPVSRANGSPELGIQLSPSDEFTAELLWTDNSLFKAPTSNIADVDVYGKGSNGFVYVRTGSAEGNAVVAIKNTSDEILWSWHIWVTNDDIQPSGTTPQGLRFMDRNLGAIGNTPDQPGTLGLLYQWGRKDPFSGANAINNLVGGNGTANENDYYPIYSALNTKMNVWTKDGDYIKSVSVLIPNSDASKGNILNAVRNPQIFIYNASSPNDWYTTDGAKHNNNLWGGYWIGDSDKTVYDPCPADWRVSKTNTLGTNAAGADFSWIDTGASPWSGLTDAWTTSNPLGHTWDTHGGFYPAAGLRNGSFNGLLYSVGTDGYYWSASPDSATSCNAGYLRFGSGAPTFAHNSNRALGFSVRCVKE